MRADGVERRTGLVERRHGLDQEEVDPALDEALHLLAVDVPGVGEADVAERLQGLPERADRTGHERASGRGLAGDARALAVDLHDLRVEAVGPELQPVRAERVGLDDVGARVDVFLVHRAHQLGVRQVELVEAAVHEHAAGVQHRAHGAVADDDAFLETARERLDRVGLGFGGAHNTTVYPAGGGPTSRERPP